jgi:hypothetical protein
MRKAFTILILALSAFYTYAAFANLSFLSSTGRLGPGFFPRIIGILLIAACLAELVREARSGSEPPRPSQHVQDMVVVAVLTGLFVMVLNILGGYLAMIAFLLASLAYLNRGRPVQNVAIALLLPTAIWLMFDVWLNASLPEGMFLPMLST